MTTITRFTKEQLIAKLQHQLTVTAKFPGVEEAELDAAIFQIALASLEAEPYGYVHKGAYEQVGSCGLSNDHEAYRDSSTHIAIYAAPPAPVVPEEKRDEDGNTTSEFDHGWNACRAATLQGAEPVTKAYKLPFEQWLSQQTGTIDVECGCVMTEVFFHWLRVAYEAGNSPVIPDGWVLVPIEPTYQMCEAMGLQWESPRFPDRYKAMLAAAPVQEAK